MDQYLRVGKARDHSPGVGNIYGIDVTRSGIRRLPPTLMSLGQTGNQDLARR